MKEAMQSLIKKFKAIGVTGSAMVTELLRFRVLDQILQTSPEVRHGGLRVINYMNWRSKVPLKFLANFLTIK